MHNLNRATLCAVFALLFQLAGPAFGQAPEPAGPARAGAANPPPPRRGPDANNFGLSFGNLVGQFDRDGDKRLNAAERKAALEFVEKEKREGRGPRRPGGRGRDQNQASPAPGPKVRPEDVKNFPNAPLYEPGILRTLFLQFDNPDWERELVGFNNTDVEVPAQLMVDGKTSRDIGVHFRGASSFFTVPEGRKRSLNLSLDFVHAKQNLGGFRTLDLLNSHTDPTYLRTVLYHHIARHFIPAPRANYVRLVINGESWGIYVNSQQFNRDFTKDQFGTSDGARWKVPGSPRASGGLQYLGEDPSAYKRHYEIKSKDEPKAWNDFIALCRVLNQTKPETWETELAPKLDIDGTLKFLALENALINNDGYWIRTSDYHIFQNPAGKFHLVPHDANETFRLPQGPGAPGSDSVELNPLSGTGDPDKPLLSKLLAIPQLRTRYLGYVRTIAEEWLDWKRLEPLARQFQALIAEDVKTDTRKLDSFEAFQQGVEQDIVQEGFRGSRRLISLKNFATQRRAYLLNHPEIKQVKSAR